MTKVIEECATQVINIPIPRKDLRSQLSYLVFRIEELIISENEAQFFLIHTTASDKKKAKKHELEMIAQERKKCEMALKNFESVIHSLMVAVRKNMREQEEQNYRNMEFQMQAQAAAQELAIAQVRLQGRSPSAMSGTNLSAVGISSRTRHGSSSNASTTSSTNSSIYGSLSRSASRNTHQNSMQGSNHNNNRRSAYGSEYSVGSGMISPSPYSPNNYSDSRMYRSPSNNIHEEPTLAKPHSYDGVNNNMLLQSPTMMHSPVTPSTEYTDPYYRHNGAEYAESSSTVNYHPFSHQQHQQMMTIDGNSYNGMDDPGFISDFGYVDDFEQGMMIDPHYLAHHQKAMSSTTGISSSTAADRRDSIWNEEQIAQRLQRGLYLPPDERD